MRDRKDALMIAGSFVAGASIYPDDHDPNTGDRWRDEMWTDFRAISKALLASEADLVELRKIKGVDAWADSVRSRARLAIVMPKDDEVDSVMSLLNWTREKHDTDSAARQWLERVVEAAVTWRDTWRHRKPFGSEEKAVALVDAVDGEPDAAL